MANTASKSTRGRTRAQRLETRVTAEQKALAVARSETGKPLHQARHRASRGNRDTPRLVASEFA